MQLNILQKCFLLGKDLPCFCYHEQLSVAGNCRMCLVEEKDNIKLLVACAVPLTEGIVIYTNSIRVKKARQSVLELLLSSHPLDCPICDQAGECDLQDIDLVFGSDKSSFYELEKRAVLNKECGVFIKTVMTRCIHCTRCVRFLNEIVGDKSLGMVSRGNVSEITTYILNYLHNELSGNIIDLCPVGALTSNPYMFSARPWELNNMESIDIFDIIGSSIRIDYFNNKLFRILPVFNKELNEEWITNKIRFIYDVNNIQRLFNPLLKNKGYYYQISWIKAFFFFLKKLISYSMIGHNVYVFLGNYEDISLINKVSKFFSFLGIEVYMGDNINTINDLRGDFLFNCNLLQIENNNNFLFLWFNPRLELPLLNSRLMRFKRYKTVFSFGNLSNYFNLDVNFCGNTLKYLCYFLKGKLSLNRRLTFCNFKFKSFFFFFKISFFCFIGMSLKFMFFFKQLYFYIKQFFLKLYGIINICNVFSYMSYINMLELGINNNFIYKFNKDFIFLIGIDEIDFLNMFSNDKNFIIYYGSYFDNGCNSAKLVFPKQTMFEKSGYMLNFLGSLKFFKKVIDAFLVIQDNFFEILYEFFKKFNVKMFFNFYYKYMVYFKFLLLDWKLGFEKFDFHLIFDNKLNILCDYFFVDNIVISSYLLNYYKSDVYTRNSKNMHLASIDFLKQLSIFK